jgi:hypothetical protein
MPTPGAAGSIPYSSSERRTGQGIGVRHLFRRQNAPGRGRLKGELNEGKICSRAP